ncbi:hypothetical protein GGS24DRAFT_509350 [Hypoxylon argillaceum]|nr:hypothetical protein GGS24DRAFT_509350 [Hypoxylon argillaceum]KAI1150169.1 hypothetical protein F4825DRAFT_452719 [Nemania diffusa]
MAEAICFVSGAPAVREVTLNVGPAILDLKQLSDMAKEVPSDIIDLTQKLDCLNLSALEIENILNSNEVEVTPYLELASEWTVVYCRMALEDLDGFIRELSLWIDSGTRPFASECCSKRILSESLRIS